MPHFKKSPGRPGFILDKNRDLSNKNIFIMSVRIRLQRFGRTKRPFYHIVVADQRVKRDGKIIEKLGHYDPTRIPAEISLDVDAAMKWLLNGAQPTNTVRAILSYKGVLYKKHLYRGVAKGAFSEEEAEKRFEAFMIEREEQMRKAKEKAEQDAMAEFNKHEKIAREKREKEEVARAAAAAKEREEAAAKEKAASEAEEEKKEETIDDVAAAAAAERGEATGESEEAASETAESESKEAPAQEAAPEAGAEVKEEKSEEKKEEKAEEKAEEKKEESKEGE